VQGKVSLQLQNAIHQPCYEKNPKCGQAKLVMSVILCQRTQSRGKTLAFQIKERSHIEGIQGLGAERDIWA